MKSKEALTSDEVTTSQSVVVTQTRFNSGQVVTQLFEHAHGASSGPAFTAEEWFTVEERFAVEAYAPRFENATRAPRPLN